MRVPLVFTSLFLCLMISNNGGGGVEASHAVYPEFDQSFSSVVHKVDQTHRPLYHFLPPKNWMNDPNGPMYYRGLYHFFYQYNPNGAIWGHIVWAHSVSQDLVNWISLEPAIFPSKPFDIRGCWSGSATILNDKPIILYTGVIDPNQTQVQNYAIPANISDPYLIKWIKPDNNPLVLPGIGVNATAFRDPSTAWQGTDGIWRMVVGGRRNKTGIAHLYTSKDFMHWTLAKQPLHSKDNTGMWECPDLYPVSDKYGLDTSVQGRNIKHVLKISLDDTRYDYYTIGQYDQVKDVYMPYNTSDDGWTGLRYDYGNFYASKTFFDPTKRRRILWGWVNESDYTPQDSIAKGWAGLQAIPRTVLLDPNGKQLIQWPIEELEKLREKHVQMSNYQLKTGNNIEVKGITAAQADVDVTFSFNSLEKAEPFDPKYRSDAQKLCSQTGSKATGGIGPFGILTLASENLEEFTPIFFRIFKDVNKHVVLLCSDATSSSLRTSNLYKPSFAGFVDVDLSNKTLSLRTLIDHSVVESYGAGGKTCITSRVYPTLAVADKAHLFVFNKGVETVFVSRLDAWSMKKPIRMNN